MYVYVRLADPVEVTLEEPQDCGRFHVTVDTVDGEDDPDGLAEAFTATGVGYLEDRHTAFVEVSVLRRLAAGRVGPSWDHDLAAMVEFATSKGWVDPGGQAVQGHIEWRRM